MHGSPVGFGPVIIDENGLTIADRHNRLHFFDPEDDPEEVDLPYPDAVQQRGSRLKGHPFTLQLSWLFAEKIIEGLVCIQEIRDEKVVPDAGIEVVKKPGEGNRVVLAFLEQCLGDIAKFLVTDRGIIRGHLLKVSPGERKTHGSRYQKSLLSNLWGAGEFRLSLPGVSMGMFISRLYRGNNRRGMSGTFLILHQQALFHDTGSLVWICKAFC